MKTTKDIFQDYEILNDFLEQDILRVKGTGLQTGALTYIIPTLKNARPCWTTGQEEDRSKRIENGQN